MIRCLLLPLLLPIIFVALVTQVTQAQLIEVKWYQIVDGKEVPVDFVVPNIPYKAVIKVYSKDYRVVTIEVRADVINWFDQIVASKTVALKPGENTIVVDFVFKHRCVLSCGEKPHTDIRGLFIRIDGIYDETNVQNRFLSGAELKYGDYYWCCLKFYVNGKEYDPGDCAPVTDGDKIKICGYLYKKGNPVPGAKIRIRYIWGEVTYTYTNDRGYFEHSTTVNGEGFKCPYDNGVKFRLASFGAYIDEKEVAYWEVCAKYICPETPTPTPTPTPLPTLTPVPTLPPNIPQEFMNQMFIVLMMLLAVFIVLIVVAIVITTLIIRD